MSNFVAENVRFAKLTNCTCPGYTVTYECTVMGGVGTVWRGSAVNCENSANEMLLLHNCFGLSDRDYTKHAIMEQSLLGVSELLTASIPLNSVSKSA